MERLLEAVVGSLLSDYISTSKETKDGNLRAYLSSSGISLHDIEFNVSKLNPSSFDIDYVSASSLEVKIPWSQLITQPIEVHLTDVEIFICNKSGKSSVGTVSTEHDEPSKGPENDKDESNEGEQSWFSTSIQSRFARHAVNLSVYVNNVLVRYKFFDSFVISCKIDSISFVNIPDNEWVDFVQDPNVWIAKGLLVQEVRIFMEKNTDLIGTATIGTLQLSCLVPLFSLLDKDWKCDTDRKIPILGELSCMNIEVTEEIFGAFYEIQTHIWEPGTPGTHQSKQRKKLEWIRELELGKEVWSLDVGLTIGKFSSRVELGKGSGVVEQAVDILLNHVMFHSESRDGSSEIVFAVESWIVDISLNQFQHKVSVFKGMTVESGSCKHALSTTVRVSKERRKTVAINVGDIVVTMPWESLDLINQLIHLWESWFAFKGNDDTDYDLLEEVTFAGHSLDMGMSFKDDKLSLLLSDIELTGNNAETELYFGLSIYLYPNISGARNTLRTSLSNKITVSGKKNAKCLSFELSTFQIAVCDLGVMTRLYGCLFGKIKEDFVKLNSNMPHFVVSIGCNQVRSCFNFKDRAAKLGGDMHIHFAIGYSKGHLSALGMSLDFLPSDVTVSIKTMTASLTEVESDVSLLEICASRMLFKQSTDMQKLCLTNFSVDFRVPSYNIEPLFQCIFCLAPENSNTDTSANYSRAVTLKTLTLTTILDDGKLAIWFSGIHFVRDLDGSERLVISNFGVNTEYPMNKRFSVICVHRKHPQALAMEKTAHAQDKGLFQCEIIAADFECKLLPSVIKFGQTLNFVKNFFLNSYKNARCIFHSPGKTTLTRVFTRIHIESANILLCPDINTSSRAIRICLHNSEIESMQGDLVLARDWLSRNLQGEMDSRFKISVETISVCLAEDIHKESMLMLPFSLEATLHVWPIDSKIFLHTRTSPLVLKLDSRSIRDIRCLLHSINILKIRFPDGPTDQNLKYQPRHDLTSLASLCLPQATVSDFDVEPSAKLILHSFSANSFSWIYRYPRQVTHIGVQDFSKFAIIPNLSFTLSAVNGSGDKESMFSFILDKANGAIKCESLGYHHNWRLVWKNPSDSLTLVELSRSIIIHSKHRDDDSLSFPDFECKCEIRKLEVLLHAPTRPGWKEQNGYECKNVIAEFSTRKVQVSLHMVRSDMKFRYTSGSMALSYTDPFDFCALTLVRAPDLEILFLKEDVSYCNVIKDWKMDAKCASLKESYDHRYTNQVQNVSHQILIRSSGGLQVLLTEFVYNDLLFHWHAAFQPVMDFCLMVENRLPCSLLVKQTNCTEILSICESSTQGFFIAYNMPRLLQFCCQAEACETAWTDPVDVFSIAKGVKTLVSSDNAMTISFEREKCLRVTVTNGAGIVNSTSEKIMLRLNQEDSKIAPGDTIYFLNLKMLISIQISHSWSNPISLDPDSQVIDGASSPLAEEGPILLINKDLESEALLYHICYPVKLTNLLSEDVKIVNRGSTHLLKYGDAADLSLEMQGGKLAEICLSVDGHDTLSLTLLCPGYGPPQESKYVIDQANKKKVYMVPEPDHSDIITFINPISGKSMNCILRPTLSRYGTLSIHMSPELTLTNCTAKTLIFLVSEDEYHVSPHKSMGVEATSSLIHVSVVLREGSNDSIHATISNLDISMSMEGIFEALLPDKKRSFKLAVDIQHEAGRLELKISPYFFITNITDYYLSDELGEIYIPGFTGALTTPVDASGAFILRQSKVRQDGTLLTVDNHIISSNRSSRDDELSDLSYSVISNITRIHFIITNERQKVTFNNCLSKDVVLMFLTQTGEQLRTAYVIQGSGHEMSLRRTDQTLRITVDCDTCDVAFEDIRIGSILYLGDIIIHRPQASRIEIRGNNAKVDVSLAAMKIELSRVSIFYYHNTRSIDAHNGFCINIDGIVGNIRRGLIPAFVTCNLCIAKHEISIIHSKGKTSVCGLLSGFVAEAEAFLGGKSKIVEYISMQLKGAKFYLDDQILSMFVKLFGAGDSLRNDSSKSLHDILSGEVTNFSNSAIIVRHFVFQEVPIEVDVHLTESPWLPIAVDASRVIIAVEEIDTYCQSSIYSVGRILKDHFVDCLVRSAPYLFGSLQVLFDPVGLVRSVRTGLFDMVRLPLQGLQKRSLSSFLTGIGYGSATFLREISSWSIGTSLGFSRAMVNLVLKKRADNSSGVASYSRGHGGTDLRMSRKIVYSIFDPQKQLKSRSDLLWYTNLTDARISLSGGFDSRVTLKISDPVMLVHESGIIVYAHCGYTPSFHVKFESLSHFGWVRNTLNITSEDCRSFNDGEKSHPSDIHLTLPQEDVDLCTCILLHCFRDLEKVVDSEFLTKG